jgi:cytochrome c
MRQVLFIAAVPFMVSVAVAQPGDATRGQRQFQNCMACHSMEPKKNLSGPSLSGIIGRKAGSIESFDRYSDALKSSNIVWDDKTLDAWLADPQHVVPGNQMPFPGIKNPQQRADIIAFLKQPSQAQQSPPMGGMMGGMMSHDVPNLKQLDNASRVQGITYCRDTYEVATADGKKRKFFERNLRFKTDSSDDGPTNGSPALVPAGMMGDRADVIFAAPGEFGRFVAQAC